jgi:hypothetical protein
MWRLSQTSRYSYPRVVAIWIDVHPTGKLDQHATCIPRSVRVWPLTIHISCGPHITIFHESSIGLDGCTTPKKKGSWLYLSAQLSDPWDPPQFLSQHSHWSSVLKPSICWRHATRLIGPILPACDQYVQYLPAWANLSILNQHRRGLQP